MNGALTIGTMGGANIEIREEVGAENFFLFGLTAAEVQARRASGYQPMDLYHSQPELREVINLIRAGISRAATVSSSGAGRQSALSRSLHGARRLPGLCRLPANGWMRPTATSTDGRACRILNTARSGKFSSDRSIREYCGEIWKAEAVGVQLIHQNEVQAMPRL